MATKQTGVYAPDKSLYVTIVDGSGNLAGAGIGTPITAVFSGADTTTATATLAGVANKTTYISGFTVSGLGATGATTVAVTVTGPTNTLTYSYVFVAGATLPNTPLAITFNTAIPASAANTAIVVTVPGAAGNTATQINAWGYQL